MQTETKLPDTGDDTRSMVDPPVESENQKCPKCKKKKCTVTYHAGMKGLDCSSCGHSDLFAG